MKNKEQKNNIIWKILSSFTFLSLFTILSNISSMFLVRNFVSVYKINTPVEVILSNFAFPLGVTSQICAWLGYNVYPAPIQPIIMLIPIIYYSALFLLPLAKNKKYFNILVILYLAWTILSVIGSPSLANSLSFD